MATFSFQNFPFPTDSIFLPNTQVKMPFPVEENNNTNCFSQFSPIEPTQQIPADVGIHESSYLDYGSKVAVTDNEPSLSQKQSPESSTVVELDGGEQVTQKVAPMARRRKYRNWASASYAQSKDRTEGKKKKQRKCSGSPEREAKKPKAEKKVLEEPPTGYIHVRARRGQATDSHSLAERVRREKISQRLKILQRLVPGCERITGKAPMLDEIINYVQSMQNQVEFLSMKLASVSPIFYDFGVDLDELVTWPEGLTSMASALPSVAQCSPTQPTLFADTASTAAFTSPDNYPFVRDSPSVLLQNEPRPSAVSQDIDSVFCDAEDQGQKFLSPSGFSNLCFFH